MGFQKPDLDDAYRAIRRCIGEISSSHNDGWTSMYCKKDLWQLKCWLNEAYDRLPKFSDEQDWEKERLLDILKREGK